MITLLQPINEFNAAGFTVVNNEFDVQSPDLHRLIIPSRWSVLFSHVKIDNEYSHVNILD